MRARQNPAVSLYQLGVYAKDPAKGLVYREEPDYTQLWQQVRAFSTSVIIEEFKFGIITPASKYYVLDQLIVDKFPADIDVLKLVELEEEVYRNIPQGERLANVPGTCEVGRAIIRFTTDICVIAPDGSTTCIDILPYNYEQVLGISPLILEAKYWLMQSYVDDLEYLIYQPMKNNSVKRSKISPRSYMKKRLYMMLQYWYTGIVNEIALNKEETNE